MSKAALEPVLTPRGHPVLAPADDAPILPPDLSRRLEESFARGSGYGLLQLGAAEVGELGFARRSRRYRATE